MDRVGLIWVFRGPIETQLILVPLAPKVPKNQKKTKKHPKTPIKAKASQNQPGKAQTNPSQLTLAASNNPPPAIWDSSLVGQGPKRPKTPKSTQN